MGVSVVACAGLIAVLVSMSPARTGARPLVLHCAAVFRPAMEQIVASYRRERDVRVIVQYGGSGTLLGGLRAGGTGDLFLPADPTYMKLAKDERLIRQSTPIASLGPVIAVREQNPLKIGSLEDLLRSDVRVGLADPDRASIGRLSREALEIAGLWEQLRPRVRVLKPTVSEIAMDLMVGSIDATILWDQTAEMIDEIVGVRVGALDQLHVVAEIGVLEGSGQVEKAAHFASYLTTIGQARLGESGFGILERRRP